MSWLPLLHGSHATACLDAIKRRATRCIPTGMRHQLRPRPRTRPCSRVCLAVEVVASLPRFGDSRAARELQAKSTVAGFLSFCRRFVNAHETAKGSPLEAVKLAGISAIAATSSTLRTLRSRRMSKEVPAFLAPPADGAAAREGEERAKVGAGSSVPPPQFFCRKIDNENLLVPSQLL
jgi:hypothetical protein